MLTNRELSDLRDAISELLPDTCNVLSVTRTSDGAGGWTEVWGTLTRAVSCRMDKASGSEGYIGAARQPFAGYILTTVYDVDLQPGYRVEHNSLTYAVIGYPNDDQSALITQRALVERV